MKSNNEIMRALDFLDTQLKRGLKPRNIFRQIRTSYSPLILESVKFYIAENFNRAKAQKEGRKWMNASCARKGLKK